MKYTEVSDFAPDVLAVLTRRKTNITFVVGSEASLCGEPFSVLSWSGSDLTLAISEEYLQSEVDSYVVEGLHDHVGSDDVDFDDSAGDVKDHAIELFTDKLLMIYHEATSRLEDPAVHNVDVFLSEVLDGDES